MTVCTSPEALTLNPHCLLDRAGDLKQPLADHSIAFFHHGWDEDRSSNGCAVPMPGWASGGQRWEYCSA
jgi:hypothetical protein